MSTKEQLLEEIENVENNQMIENDYTELQKNLWPDETVESLSEKAQKAWENS